MSSKIKIVADNKIPFLQGVLEPFADIGYLPGSDITKNKILNADALIIRTRTKCNEQLLDGTGIKIIATATIGTDHIDEDFCNKNNIRWINAPGCNSTSVMQYVASALLTIAKKENFKLKEKTLGIIGVGNVGSKVQRFAETMGMKVLLNDPPRERKEGNKKFCGIDELIKQSDIITFHVPLITKGEYKTFHLADEKFFGKLKKNPVILNTSRGEVIKTSAIKDAIKNHIISATVLDVWENEPVPDLELIELTDIATPHIAGYSVEGKANGTAACVNEVNKFFHLGLQANWYPENLPMPVKKNKITIDCKNKHEQEIISDAVNYTYSVLDDDKIFRNATGKFEKLRGNYHVRREFGFYTLILKNCNNEIKNKLAELGFTVGTKTET